LSVGTDENQFEVRRLNGLKPLISLLWARNQNAVGAIMNCAAKGASVTATYLPPPAVLTLPFPTDETNREEIRRLDGIKPLIALLQSPVEEIQRRAAGALANLAVNGTRWCRRRRRGGGSLTGARSGEFGGDPAAERHPRSDPGPDGTASESRSSCVFFLRG
jgi:hypothetical protein